jgi:hypothetical protein
VVSRDGLREKEKNNKGKQRQERKEFLYKTINKHLYLKRVQ